MQGGSEVKRARDRGGGFRALREDHGVLVCWGLREGRSGERGCSLKQRVARPTPSSPSTLLGSRKFSQNNSSPKTRTRGVFRPRVHPGSHAGCCLDERGLQGDRHCITLLSSLHSCSEAVKPLPAPAGLSGHTSPSTGVKASRGTSVRPGPCLGIFMSIEASIRHLSFEER